MSAYVYILAQIFDFAITFSLYSKIFPSVEMVITCHGINFPL